MKRLLFPLSLIILLLLSCNRDKQHIQTQIARLEGRQVILRTEKMGVVVPCHPSSAAWNRNAKLVVVMFVDSNSCSPCEMRKLVRWRNFIDTIAVYNGQIQTCFIFDVPHDKISETKTMARYMTERLCVPLFLDTLHTFVNDNNLQLEQETNIITLDENHRICLVGNPFSNSKMKELFWKKVEQSEIRLIPQ